MRRITKATLGGLAGCALVLGGTQAASGALSTIFEEKSENLLTTSLNSAKATITITQETNSTTFRIDLTQIDKSEAGKMLGSHLHTGPCVEEDGGSAGPHYNHDVVTENKRFPGPDEKTYGYTAEVSRNTEVWFNLRPDAEGKASDETTVPFVPVDPDGVMSVVVHALETNIQYGSPNADQPAGWAGTRQACFPLSVSGTFPTE
jgi:Cu/Zn superoxide dismutase